MSTRRHGRRLGSRSALAAVLLAFAACANDPSRVPAGATRDQVLQQLGTPTAVYRVSEGERLQYSRGPAGFAVFNIDLDASGRVRSVRQELQEGLFDSTIRPSEWRVDDVLRTYGPPYQQTRVASFNGTVWSWRYLQINSPRFLYIYIDPTGRVDHFNVGDDLEFNDRRRW
jgi:hypothetical protein